MLLALILIAILIGVIEGLPLARKKKWKEFITVLSLLIFAILLGLMKLLNMSTPLDILGNTLSPIGKAFFDANK